MTATTDSGALRVGTSSDALLRLAMRVDAVLVFVAGVAVLAAAGWLSDLTGLSRPIEYGFAVFSVVYGLVVLGLAGVERVRPAGIGTVIANVLCTVIAVVAAVSLPLTAIGVALVVAIGLYTAVMAEWQFIAVRRIAA
ncbi:hypothetical protein ACAG25_23775 [Mycobacterium sp. pV006]|uniref:hypothetical protein n=1 Tax=Mycobacterium sp. pV006 TaxID=3238983 RepID=UPI00351B730C